MASAAFSPFNLLVSSNHRGFCRHPYRLPFTTPSNVKCLTPSSLQCGQSTKASSPSMFSRVDTCFVFDLAVSTTVFVCFSVQLMTNYFQQRHSSVRRSHFRSPPFRIRCFITTPSYSTKYLTSPMRWLVLSFGFAWKECELLCVANDSTRHTTNNPMKPHVI